MIHNFQSFVSLPRSTILSDQNYLDLYKSIHNVDQFHRIEGIFQLQNLVKLVWIISEKREYC